MDAGILFNGVESRRRAIMPLGLLALASHLRSQSRCPTLLDSQLDADWEATLRRESKKAQWLGISCLTGQGIKNAHRAAQIFRSERPDRPIIFGGYHFASEQTARQVLEEGLGDYVVRGQGERPLSALLDLLDAGAEIGRHNLPRSVYARLDGEIIFEPGPKITDINALVPLDYSLFDVEAYFARGSRDLPYLSSVGCPFKCAFCSEPQQTGRRWKGLNADRVVDELVALQERYNPEIITFIDPLFLVDCDRAVAIGKGLIERRFEGQWFVDARANTVLKLEQRHPGSLKMLRKAGLGGVFIGVESGSAETLKKIDKGLRPEQVVPACELLAEAGIVCVTSFIHDFPGETVEENADTFDLACRLSEIELNAQSHHVYSALPGTEIYDDLVSQPGSFAPPQRFADWANASTWAGGLYRGNRALREVVVRKLSWMALRSPRTFRYTIAHQRFEKGASPFDFIKRGGPKELLGSLLEGFARAVPYELTHAVPWERMNEWVGHQVGISTKSDFDGPQLDKNSAGEYVQVQQSGTA